MEEPCVRCGRLTKVGLCEHCDEVLEAEALSVELRPCSLCGRGRYPSVVYDMCHACRILMSN